MAEKRVQRRLAAILSADVVGYSRLIEADEEGTRARLRSLHAELIEPKISTDGGRIVKTTGDGILVEFASAVDAVRNALAIQEAMRRRNADVAEANRIEFRVGINVGDVIIEGEDIHGDGVNVASRLEGLCEPGEVYVSGTVYDQVAGKFAASFDNLGEQLVKNLTRPVRVYRARGEVQEEMAPAQTESGPPSPDKPSIAVLPFENMSGDPEQEYFSDGITEDIITALANVRSFTVLARNSTFVFKGKSVDAKRIGSELGVRYLVEGSVRKAGQRVRVTAQLIETASGDHVWAERYDGTLEDIFDLQDEITAAIVGTIEPELLRAEAERIKQKRPDSMDAYDYLLRGFASMNKLTPEATREALDYFRKAIEIDSNYGRAYSYAAWCYRREVQVGGMTLSDIEKADATDLMQKALELGKNDPVVLWQAGSFKVYFEQDFDGATALIDRSLAMNPNSPRAWNASAECRGYMGDTATSIRDAERAMAVSPRNPSHWVAYWSIARANLQEKRYEEAAKFAKMALQFHERGAPACHILAAACAHLGRMDEARAAIAKAQAFDPKLTISRLKAIYPIARLKNLDAFLDGLRKAGLPE